MRRPDEIRDHIDEIESDIAGNAAVQESMRAYVTALEWVLDGDANPVYGDEIDRIEMAPEMFESVLMGGQTHTGRIYIGKRVSQPATYLFVRSRSESRTSGIERDDGV